MVGRLTAPLLSATSTPAQRCPNPNTWTLGLSYVTGLIGSLPLACVMKVTNFKAGEILLDSLDGPHLFIGVPRVESFPCLGVEEAGQRCLMMGLDG